MVWGTSPVIYCPPTGTVDPEIPENAVSIIPNPADDAVTVDFSGPVSGILAVHLSNLTEKKVLKTTGRAFPVCLDLDHLDGGIYFLKLFVNGREFRGRFIRE
jgi:hypothetical protein